jgi:hypothetical protein
MDYRVPFRQIREDMLSASARQMARALGVDVELLREFETDRKPLPEDAQYLADCLLDGANSAMSGDQAKRQEVERLGRAIRGLDDLPTGQVDAARLKIVAHIRGLAQEGRAAGRSAGPDAGRLPQELRESSDYLLSECQDYDRLLKQVLTGGAYLRRQVADVLGSGAPSYGWFNFWGGMAGAESRSDVYAGCTLITASGWGFQARGNSWQESINPLTENVSYRGLLTRSLLELKPGSTPDDSMPMHRLERSVALAYASKTLSVLDDEIVGGARELAKGLKPTARQHQGEWADLPLLSDSPLRLLGLIQAADWEARGQGLKALDIAGGAALSKIAGKALKAQSKKLVGLLRTHPVAAAVGTLAIVTVGVTAWHVQQQLERAAAALTLVHLSELGLLPVEAA